MNVRLPLLPDSASVSERGLVREENEDRVAIVSDPARGALLAVVADGMGGHASGEVASRLAVATIARRRRLRARRPDVALAEGFVEANEAIRKAARRDPGRSGMGTTCTALLLRDGEGFCAHVGDSRLYLVRDGAIYLLTEDDSAVMAMVRRGVLTRDEARRHAERNVLERALGTRDEVEAVVWREPLAVRPSDAFVLCTDGLHDLVDDGEIRDVVTSTRPGPACERLVAMACARGGHDNVSAAVIRAPGDEA